MVKLDGIESAVSGSGRIRVSSSMRARMSWFVAGYWAARREATTSSELWASVNVTPSPRRASTRMRR